MDEFDTYLIDEDWEEEGVDCLHCDLGFVEDAFLAEHINKAEQGSRGGCQVLRRKKNMEEVTAGLKTHVCDECDMGFKTASELKVHKFTHTTARPWICPHCGLTYKTKGNLNEHILTSHKQRRFQCPECDKSFGRKAHMDRHKNSCTITIKQFKCSDCGKKFSQAATLKRHVNQVHKRQMPFKCQECQTRGGGGGGGGGL